MGTFGEAGEVFDTDTGLPRHHLEHHHLEQNGPGVDLTADRTQNNWSEEVSRPSTGQIDAADDDEQPLDYLKKPWEPYNPERYILQAAAAQERAQQAGQNHRPNGGAKLEAGPAKVFSEGDLRLWMKPKRPKGSKRKRYPFADCQTRLGKQRDKDDEDDATRKRSRMLKDLEAVSVQYSSFTIKHRRSKTRSGKV